MAEFEIFVSKGDFKFNCAHFIAFDGFRERLHGHNYQMSIRVVGDGNLGDDGYLIDFGDIKKAARGLCKEMNEFFICPTLCPDLNITTTESQVCIECKDGALFSFPKSDCAMLPILHSSAEEMSHYFWINIVKRIGLEALHHRGVKMMEVAIAEAHNQSAAFRAQIPATQEALDVLAQTPVRCRPQPCLASSDR